MASETVTPIAARLSTFVRQDDNPVRNGAISAAVNVPDETISKGVVWLDENKLGVEIDEAGLLALLNEELTDYAAHRASAVFHAPADTTNTVVTTAVTSIVVAKIRANLLKAALLAHFANTGGTYHDDVDDVNGPLLTAVPDATDVQSLRTLLLAIKSYYNAHLTAISVGLVQVHPANDGVNDVTTADPDPLAIGPVTLTGYPDVQVFTANGTWTKPTTFTPTRGRSYLVGGGGGGGSGARHPLATDTCGGTPGSGGGVSFRDFDAADLGATESVTIGQGGAGGAAIGADNTDGNSGANGTATTFGSLLRAGPGIGGAGGTTAAAPSVGAGGLGDIRGGEGGAAVTGGGGLTGASASGAGGGGAGGGIGALSAFGGGSGGINYSGGASGAAGGGNTGGAGVNGTASTTDGPGNGGGGGGANAGGAGGAGGNGSNYGGGGGGGGSSPNGSNSGAGGDGADGIAVIITY